MSELDWTFPFEEPLHEVFPALHDAQSAWLAQVDSLHAPDRKTHELIRMVVTVMLRNAEGVQRHAQLAAEVGATWEEVLGSIMLTVPGAGVLPAVQAIPVARAGFEAAGAPDDSNDDSADDDRDDSNDDDSDTDTDDEERGSGAGR